MAALRHIWITRRQPFMANMLTRIGFIDETSVKTNMAKTTGWAPRGERLVDHAPFGHWRTQTFIAALRHDRLDAPWVIDGPINRDLFDLYIATQLAPTLQPGDVIILDNLSSHKSPKAAQALQHIGCWFLPLPPYSPDLNPIEMAFAKLKSPAAQSRRPQPTTDLWKAVGRRLRPLHRGRMLQLLHRRRIQLQLTRHALVRLKVSGKPGAVQTVCMQVDGQATVSMIALPELDFALQTWMRGKFCVAQTGDQRSMSGVRKHTQRCAKLTGIQRLFQ